MYQKSNFLQLMKIQIYTHPALDPGLCSVVNQVTCLLLMSLHAIAR